MTPRLSLEEALAALEDPVTPDSLRPWRERIDELDRALLTLLNERMVCAHVIGHAKRILHLPVYVPEREAAVLRNVTEANEGPLTDGAVRRIFERIIDETRSQERQGVSHS